MKIQFVGPFISEDYFIVVRRGMEEAGRDLKVDVAFTGDPGGNLDEVNRVIREAADSGKVDGLAVNITNAKVHIDAIKYAMGKGIPVVAFNVDATNGKGPHLAHTQQEFLKAGTGLGNYMAAFIPDGSKVLLNQHDAGISALEDRAAGIRRALEDKKLTFIDLVTTSTPEGASARIEEALKTNPDIKAILCTGQADVEGSGIVNKKIGSRLPVAGFGISPQILKMIIDGSIKLSIDQQPYVEGYYPVMQLVLNIRYGIMPCNMDSGTNFVDSKNADTVLALANKGYR
jgi:simple sugar transport system substrate-binding protein